MGATYSDDKHPPYEQHNEGDGIFIGRDNYGPIQHLDAATKEILKRLSREAPALAEMIRRAMREGIVSLDVVYALEYAARCINEDVAMTLERAGRNINEDSAAAFMGVAVRLEQLTSHDYGGLHGAANRLESLIERIERASTSSSAAYSPGDSESLLNRIEERFATLRRDIKSNKGVVAAPPARVIVAWKPTFYAFFFGVLLGLALFGYTLYLLNR